MPAQVAHAAHIWIAKHIPKPFMVPLGLVSRRGKLGSTVLSDRIAARSALLLCYTCEHKLPVQWLRRFEYRLIPGYHSSDTRCDGCQEVTSVNIYNPEDGGYYQEYQKLQRIERQAGQAQLQIHDKRRVR